MPRTIRDFEVNGSIWEFVDNWSKIKGFEVNEFDKDRRVYKKGNPLFNAPLWVDISQNSSRVHLEIWLSIDAFTRIWMMISSFFIMRLTREIGIEPDGLFAEVPKQKYREEVNELLEHFKQPPVL